MKHQHLPYSLYNLFKLTKQQANDLPRKLLGQFINEKDTKISSDSGELIDSKQLDYLQAGYFVSLSKDKQNDGLVTLSVHKLRKNIYSPPDLLASMKLQADNFKLEQIKQDLKSLLPSVEQTGDLYSICNWRFDDYRNANPNFELSKYRVVVRQLNLTSNDFIKLDGDKFKTVSVHDILLGTVGSGFAQEAFDLGRLFAFFQQQELTAISSLSHLHILAFIGAFLPADHYAWQRIIDCKQQVDDMLSVNSFPSYHIGYLAIELMSFISEQQDILQWQSNAYNEQHFDQLLQFVELVGKLLLAINQQLSVKQPQLLQLPLQAINNLQQNFLALQLANQPIIDLVETIKVNLSTIEMRSVFIIIKTLETIVNNSNF